MYNQYYPNNYRDISLVDLIKWANENNIPIENLTIDVDLGCGCCGASLTIFGYDDGTN